MAHDNTNTPLHIDVDQVLRQRLPRHYRYIPKCLVAWLKRTICQDELNAIAAKVFPCRGVEAATMALAEMGVKINVVEADNIPSTGRFVFASNHPLGGLDGLALISFLGQRYGGNIRFVVNDLLTALSPLENLFLPVNKHGRQSRECAKLIEEQCAGDTQIITFPAGLCSRMMKDGEIHDLKWNKFFVTHAAKYHRDIIPVYFEGRNSMFFYRFAKLRERLGLKFNIEMIYLPSEMIKRKNSTFTIHIGKPIPWTTLSVPQAAAEAARICNMVYAMAPHKT